MEAVKEGTRVFSIHGGDALFEYGNDLFTLLKELVDNRCDVILSTKSLINADKADQLRQSGIKRMQLSIDTNDSSIERKLYGECGYYNSFKESLNRLKENSINVNVNVVVSNINLCNVFELVQELAKMDNVNTIIVSWYEPTVNNTAKYELTEEEKTKLVNDLNSICCRNDILREKIVYGLKKEKTNVTEKSVCANGRFKFMIFPDGSSGVCDFVDDSNFKIGNVREHSIKEIWNAEEYVDLVYIRNNSHDNRCKECKVYFVCAKRGRCFNKMLIRNNGEFGPDYMSEECCT